ncbi:outer membrane lipoprotein chaperone LolA [Alteromonas sp. ASW11-130]|uniref:outer membrane lipoprotein chaperone LolA n=1 Tax=Alteromonas sp. ASW11-130 TaxID=3015775 RepID=UPI002241C6A4|nr:outer membrane lipoprotein chaperone LolA [Alteromonas sp. ASW11-130]MCW8092394.1 outer membrane lipoprotein chaperone LolA [Alteromonas sp. ASW11-130]
MGKVLRFMSLSLLTLSLNVLANSDEMLLKQKLADMEQYRASFKQVVKDSSDEVVHQSTGRLVMARPNKLRWQTDSPDEVLLIADGEKVWNIDRFVEQVTIMSQRLIIADNPFVLLTNTSEEAWSQFEITKLADTEKFVVTPKADKGQIKRLILKFKGNQLIGLTMRDAQEQTSELRFTNIETQFSVVDDMFNPTFPETFTVDDQR